MWSMPAATARLDTVSVSEDFRDGHKDTAVRSNILTFLSRRWNNAMNHAADAIPAIHRVDDEYVSDAVRSFSKVTVLYIPGMFNRSFCGQLFDIPSFLLLLLIQYHLNLQ